MQDKVLENVVVCTDLSTRAPHGCLPAAMLQIGKCTLVSICIVLRSDIVILQQQYVQDQANAICCRKKGNDACNCCRTSMNSVYNYVYSGYMYVPRPV